VYERSPPFGRDTRVTQLAHSRVEGVRNRIGVHHLLCEQLLVEPLSDFRPIGVRYGPTHTQHVLAYTKIPINIPYRCDHALKSTEEHGGCKVHYLIWLLLVAFGCLACAEKSQKRIVKLQLHEIRDRQSTVAKTEPALGRIANVLDAVTSKMDDTRLFHSSGCVPNGRRTHPLM
jgi:hypothetical protein